MKFYRLPAMALVVLALGCMGAEKTRNEASEISSARTSSQPSCKDCHDELSSMLGDDHPPVKGSLSDCYGCHPPAEIGAITPNRFAVRIHSSHLPPLGKADCLECHLWTEGTYFGLPGCARSMGAPNQEDMVLMKEIFDSWLSSEYMDRLHARAFVSCANCHGKQVPVADATLDNCKCLECHGPIQDLVKATEPEDLRDCNPHQSHLGEIGCTVCHKAHSESKVYCLGCHVNFQMTIPGAGSDGRKPD